MWNWKMTPYDKLAARCRRQKIASCTDKWEVFVRKSNTQMLMRSK